MNSDTDIARRYHEQTKHSYWSIRTNPHYLDWYNKPEPFKVYPKLTPITLPRDFTPSGISALEALSKSANSDAAGELDLDTLASLLFYTAGVTKRRPFPGGTIYFRAAACAGALYPIEVYIVCGGITGLDAGVYHFNPGDFSLRMLREGDYRRALSEASGGSDTVARSPVTVIYSAISWRSTWKYQSRAYRYHYWDSGTMLAHSIAMAAAHNLRHQILMGFVDDEVNRLIGVDGIREFAVALAPVGKPEADSGRTRTNSGDANHFPIDPIDPETIPLSRSEVAYPLIPEMHRESSLLSSNEVVEWKKTRYAIEDPQADPSRAPIELLPKEEIIDEPIEKVIERRASTRRFAQKPISFEDLSTIIDKAIDKAPDNAIDNAIDKATDNAITPTAADVCLATNTLYLIANDIQGLESGAYYFNASGRSLEQLRAGSFRREAAHLTLDQDLGGEAAVTFFLMADLNRVLAAYGNRGYRVAEMEAGIIGGRMYLTAYALGRGATGLTFYDDEVTEFFSPHAAGKSCMLVVSVGVPGKRPIY